MKPQRRAPGGATPLERIQQNHFQPEATMKGLAPGERLLSNTAEGIRYERDGQQFTARRATQDDLERWHREGLIDNAAGTCTCGSADFCDSIAHRRVRCFEDSAGVCNWHTTSDVC